MSDQSKLWSDPNADPLADIERWQKTIYDTYGLKPDPTPRHELYGTGRDQAGGWICFCTCGWRTWGSSRGEVHQVFDDHAKLTKK